MLVHIYQVDAFTTELFKGNSAAVIILNEWLSDDLMQNIALENNLAETAFITPTGTNLHIRWFTPTMEVDLCGHATLAGAHVLFNHEDLEGDQISFRSRSGLLKVTRNNKNLVLDFPVDEISKINELPELMKLDSKHWVKEIYKGKSDIMFVLDNEKQILEFEPNLDVIRKMNCRGVIITASGENTDFVSRFFAPQSGIDEDPVTGSAHTTLTPYWTKRLNKQTLTAAQLSKRGGNLTCELKGNRVLIGGNCKTYLKGELFINI